MNRSGSLGLFASLAVALAAGFTRTAEAQDRSPFRSMELSFSWAGEVVENAAGGVRRGARVTGLAGAELTILLDRLVGWTGARIFAYGVGTLGEGPSKIVGDLQGVSNIQAPASAHLEEIWLQQNLLRDRLSLLAGRYDLNSEFYRLQSAALFMNSSFGIGPELGLSGRAGPSIFPNTAVGARFAFKPSSGLVARMAVLDGVPVGRPGGTQLFASGDGLLLAGEVALLSRADSDGEQARRRFQIGRGLTRSYTGKVALGAWYYTAEFPGLSATTSDAPVRHRGSAGGYLIGDQTLWSRGEGRPGSLAGFLQVGLGDGRVNQVGSYLGGGFTLSAPLVGRGQDALGLALAVARNGSPFDRSQAASGTQAADETAIEFTYQTQLGPWLAVQPDLQFVIHPGGTATRGNAVVAGLRVAVSL